MVYILFTQINSYATEAGLCACPWTVNLAADDFSPGQVRGRTGLHACPGPSSSLLAIFPPERVRIELGCTRALDRPARCLWAPSHRITRRTSGAQAGRKTLRCLYSHAPTLQLIVYWRPYWLMCSNVYYMSDVSAVRTRIQTGWFASVTHK